MDTGKRPGGRVDVKCRRDGRAGGRAGHEDRGKVRVGIGDERRHQQAIGQDVAADPQILDDMAGNGAGRSEIEGRDDVAVVELEREAGRARSRRRWKSASGGGADVGVGGDHPRREQADGEGAVGRGYRVRRRVGGELAALDDRGGGCNPRRDGSQHEAGAGREERAEFGGELGWNVCGGWCSYAPADRRGPLGTCRIAQKYRGLPPMEWLGPFGPANRHYHLRP